MKKENKKVVNWEDLSDKEKNAFLSSLEFRKQALVWVCKMIRKTNGLK